MKNLTKQEENALFGPEDHEAPISKGNLAAGPWDYTISEHDEGAWYAAEIWAADKSKVCDIGYDSLNNIKALASQISASPDLLAACKLALKYIDHPEVRIIPFALHSDCAVDRLRAAIAKAEYKYDVSQERKGETNA